VIAHATKARRSLRISKSTPRVQASKPKRTVVEAALVEQRRQVLRARRESLFGRTIDYIPCRQFLKADAERLATLPPADSLVPLRQRGGERAAGDVSPYLASLYETRLLTKDEEQFYFRRMNWLKFRAATARGRLDRRRASLRQIDEIEGWLAEAESVKGILITSNLRLVVSIAKKFVDVSNSFEELVSEGNVALMRSVEKFSFALGNRFSTYATYAIQRHFFRLSQKGRQFRSRFVADDEALRGRASEAPITDRCSSAQIDTLKELFSGFLEGLEAREKQIVVARFGFDGRPSRTFRELGVEMGVCKERIRQIQTRAMEKLRQMAAEARLEQTVGDWL
jgi:RNA polymerase primary sigma factor